MVLMLVQTVQIPFEIKYNFVVPQHTFRADITHSDTDGH